MPASTAGIDMRAARRALAGLQQIERELVELRYVRRSDALEGSREAVARLADLGSPTAILDRAGAELGTRSRFRRVLLSRLRGRELTAISLWIDGDADEARELIGPLRDAPRTIDYPLIEAEVAQQRRGQISAPPAPSRAGRPAPSGPDWGSHVVVPVILHGTVVGMLHADNSADGPAVDDVDLEVAELFADGLAGAFERAVLREALLQHRHALQSAIQWIDGRLAGLAADAVTTAAAEQPSGEFGLADPLTPREAEVMALLGRGLTNLAIANALVVREGTVKYHVKNILRKLGATSRADAVARYARANLSGSP